MTSLSRATIVASLLCAAVPVVAQEKTQKAGRKAGEAFGRVVRAKGKVLVELPGKGWNPLKPDQILKNGQRVKVGSKGSLELTVADTEAEAKRARVYSGDRVIVAKGSILRVGPVGTKDDLDLEQGEVFGQSLRDLKVRLGVSRLELGVGDAHASRKKNGKATVVVLQGKAGLRLPQRRLELGAKDRVRISATGEAKLTSGTRVRVPKFVTSADALQTTSALLYRETFRKWVWVEKERLFRVQPTDGKGLYESWLRWPESKRQLRRSMGMVEGLPGPIDASDPNVDPEKVRKRGTGRFEVRIGRPARNGQAGLCRWSPAAVLRVTYRTSSGSRVDVRVTQGSGGGPFEGKAPGRAGLWTTVEYPLRLVKLEAAKEGKLSHISFDAGLEGKRGKVEVREITVYVPEGAGP